MDSLSRLLEIAGLTTTEKKKLYIYVAGNHGSGKTNLIQSFSKEIPNAARSTFGFEMSSFIYQDELEVSIIQVTETTPDNEVLASFASKNIENSVALFLFDVRNPNKVDETVENLVKPFFEKTIGKVDAKKQEELAKYYTKIASSEPIAHSKEVMTTPTYMPVFFVGTFDDSLVDLTDPMFDGYLHALRKAALPYGAGIVLSHAKSLLKVIIACLTRQQIPENLWDKICEREDYFIPPSWDSLEKVNTVEREEVEEKKEEENVIEEREVQNWQDFLNDLSKQKREEDYSSPRKKQEEIESQQDNDIDGYFSQFA